MKMRSKEIIFFLSIPLLASVILLQNCSNGCPLIKRQLPTNSAAKIENKIDIIKNWVPESVNAFLLADIYELSKSKAWKEKNIGTVLMKYIEAPGLDLSTDIGVICIIMDIESANNAKGPVIFIQGGFNQELLISRISDEMKKNSADLILEEYKKLKIYRTQDNTQAFASLDDGLFAVAGPKDIRWIVDQKSQKNILSMQPDISDQIFGTFNTKDSIKEDLPKPWKDIISAKLTGGINDEININLSLLSNDAGNVERLKTAVEGIIAFELIAHFQDEDLINMNSHLNVESLDNSVIINFNLQ